MSPSHTSLLLLALLTLTASTSATPTIYDIVNQFGFPSGILPDSVTSYTTLADGDGFSFAISLKKPCYVKYDYLVHFDSTITGKITYGKITELKGLTAQSFFFWLNIDEMTLNSNSITFTLGFVNVDLDIKQFETIPTCKDKALADCDDSSSLISKTSSATRRSTILSTSSGSPRASYPTQSHPTPQQLMAMGSPLPSASRNHVMSSTITSFTSTPPSLERSPTVKSPG